MDTSQTRLAYIAEVTYGTTPATPAFQVLRYTSESLTPNIQYVSSNEIVSHRNVTDLTQVGGEAGGDIGVEISYGTLDTFLEALLQGTWSSNVLKNGVTPKSFTIEKTFENGATDEYHRYVGARINSFNIRMSAKEQITGSFSVMAKTATSAQAIISGATYVAANTNPIMNASSMFQSLAMSGITAPELMSLDMTITNNMRQQPVMGSLGSKGIGSGRFVVTGTFEAYFANSDMLNAYINNTTTTLDFEIGGVSSLKYAFAMDKVKFSGVEILTPGNDQDVMARVSFQAIYDGTAGCTLEITRTP